MAASAVNLMKRELKDPYSEGIIVVACVESHEERIESFCNGPMVPSDGED